MPLTIFFALLTLAPLVMALALTGLGLARRATTGLALGLTLIGAIIPIIGLALLAPEVSAGFPLEIALLGDKTSWVALYGRADALGVYAAIGVAVVVAPLLLWMAWRAAPLDADEAAEVAASEADDAGDADEVDAADESGETLQVATVAAAPRALGRWQWAGVALALTLETLALWVCFAENIVLLGIVWVALVVVAWLLGELSSEAAIFDWRGLGLMVVGPLVWLVTTLLIAGPAGARLLLDLTGAARLPTGHLIALSLALAFAAGAYPALVWLRKRASIATPAGLAAAALLIMPVALFVGERTFSIGATSSSVWAASSVGKPPLTVGIVLTVLGVASVVAAGLLALGRRDPRSLVASLTLAQAGWGLLGLGVGAPLSLLGVTLLLATGVLGLGAVLASLVAAGAITAEVEPESAGPRILGEPLRPALLFAWGVGVVSLLGAPLFAGFAPLQLISAEALTGPRLSVPLVGFAWVGAVLLAIALIRATAPAFTAPLVAVYGADETDDADATDDAGDATEVAAHDAAEDESESESEAENGDEVEEVAPASAAPELRLEELPGVALGIVLVLAGIAPGVAVSLASGAASATLQAGALDGIVASTSSGYAAGVGQWFATAPTIFVVIGALVLAYVRSRAPREIRPLYLAGQTPDAVAVGAGVDVSDVAEATEAGEVEPAAEQAAELVALPEPSEAWGDLHGALRSGWLTPGAAWLGLDADADDDGAAADDARDGSDEDGEDDEDGATATADDAAPRANGALTPKATSASARSSARSKTPTPDSAGGKA